MDFVQWAIRKMANICQRTLVDIPSYLFLSDFYQIKMWAIALPMKDNQYGH